MIYLWLKVWHLISVICWFAGLFYLPRLFVYHSEAEDSLSQDRFIIMERKLHNIIMMPAMTAVLLTGGGLFYLNAYRYIQSTWFLIKISALILLLLFQARCTWHMLQFRQHKNHYTRKYYIPFNEIPSVLLITIIIMVVIKPFE